MVKNNLEDFKAELIKLCAKYQFQLRVSSEDDISIEVIINRDDGYVRELQSGIWLIGPDRIEASDNP